MMPRKTEILLTVALLSGAHAGFAQPGESLSPLHAQPREGALQAMQRSDLNELFLYDFLPQELPIQDDFSVDRTRSRWSQAGDPDVSLDQIVYRLDTNGTELPEMEFALDTTYYFRWDTSSTGADSLAVQLPLPSYALTIRDLTVWPVSLVVVDAWPPYNVFVSLDQNTQDTLGVNPDVIQDSLLVYTVDADTRTYMQGGTQVPLILWEDDYAYINGTYPVDPPTIGVATFDGLDRTGFPYRFDQPTAYGLADRLTSVPIDLSYQVSDSVYLSFFHQPQGLSGDDQIQPIDSLLLEFYAPVEDQWYLMWWSEYTALAPFRQVMLPITDERFLHDGFRMRFSNKATLSGALDHWHIDYVRLDENRSFSDTVLVDVAWVYPESSLLQTYTAVPFKAFEQSPASYMAGNVGELMKNLDVVDKFITWGCLSGIEGGPLTNAFGAGNNISGNASSTFGTAHPVANNAPPFLYDPSLSTDDAFWRTKMWANATPDINRYNDTISFVQELSNYYAYDDGSAEAGYSLNVAGGKMAYRFDLATGDSLRAIRCYFDPIFEDPSDGSFLITIWTSLTPEVIQHQNFSFSSPEYRIDGLNKFVEYPLDSTIWVEGTIYVGWVQTTADKLNLGFDKNRNNQDKIFYKVSGGFLNTSFEGSLMLRPVFVSDTDPFTGIPEQAGPGRLQLYPNPASDRFQVRADGVEGAERLRILDALGREAGSWSYREGAPIDLGSAPSGTYIVQLLGRAGAVLATGRIIVQR